MSERGNAFPRFLDYWAGIPLCFLTAFLRKFHSPDFPVQPKKVCILCQGAIGDLLLLSVLTNALYKKFPETEIDLYLSEANFQAAALLSDIHSAMLFQIRHPFQLISRLRKEKYDLLIDASQWARLGGIVSNCSGSGYTVGFKSAGQWRHFGYDKKVLHCSRMHEKDNFLSLGRAIWKDLEGECAIRIPEQRELEAAFGSQRWICLHMWPSGVKSWLKEWPQQRWQELCQHLLDAGHTLLLSGGQEDRERTESFIKNNFRDVDRIYSLAGKYNLAETAWFLKKAEALVSVNTGIMHLGALASVPTIGLHGPTNPMRWGPLGSSAISLLPSSGMCAYLNLGFEYPENATNTLGLISVDKVLEALDKLGVKADKR